jgi:hypothetical protein
MGQAWQGKSGHTAPHWQQHRTPAIASRAASSRESEGTSLMATCDKGRTRLPCMAHRACVLAEAAPNHTRLRRCVHVDMRSQPLSSSPSPSLDLEVDRCRPPSVPH